MTGLRPSDDARWLSAPPTYRQFAENLDHNRVPVRHVTDEGLATGKWVANQKSIRQRRTSDSPRGPVGGRSVLVIVSMRGIAAGALRQVRPLRRAAMPHVHLEEEWEGWMIGAWKRSHCRAYSEGRLRSERHAALVAASMWSWIGADDPRPTWSGLGSPVRGVTTFSAERCLTERLEIDRGPVEHVEDFANATVVVQRPLRSTEEDDE